MDVHGVSAAGGVAVTNAGDPAGVGVGAEVGVELGCGVELGAGVDGEATVGEGELVITGTSDGREPMTNSAKAATIVRMAAAGRSSHRLVRAAVARAGAGAGAGVVTSATCRCRLSGAAGSGAFLKAARTRSSNGSLMRDLLIRAGGASCPGLDAAAI
jgi:hypothetical protein